MSAVAKSLDSLSIRQEKTPNHDRPQQQWSTGSNLESWALFAGHEMFAEMVSDSKPEASFILRYMGFETGPFSSLMDAKNAGPNFARQVLSHMHDVIARAELS